MPDDHDRRWILRPVGIYLAVLVVLVIVMWLSVAYLPLHSENRYFEPSFPGSGWLGGWVRWDGGWYKTIASSGYSYTSPDQQSSVAFFPAYPMTMRLINIAVRDLNLAGIITTWICGLGVVVMFYRWCTMKFDDKTATRAVILLSVYPYAWYLFGAVYADAMFIFAAIAAFVLLEMDRPVLAGLCGVVATAARPIGVAVVVGLVAVTIVRRGGWRRLRPGDAGVLIAGAGLGAWMTYLWIRFGNPMLFSTVEGARGWDQTPGAHTWFKTPFFARVDRLAQCSVGWTKGLVEHQGSREMHLEVDGIACRWNDAAFTMGIFFQAVLLVVMAVLAYVVWKKLGWGYALYVACVILIPLIGSKDFQGVGRYMLAAFPCFAVAADLLGVKPRLRIGWMVVSAMLLVSLSSAYARNYYLA